MSGHEFSEAPGSTISGYGSVNVKREKDAGLATEQVFHFQDVRLLVRESEATTIESKDQNIICLPWLQLLKVIESNDQNKIRLPCNIQL